MDKPFATSHLQGPLDETFATSHLQGPGIDAFASNLFHTSDGILDFVLNLVLRLPLNNRVSLIPSNHICVN